MKIPIPIPNTKSTTAIILKNIFLLISLFSIEFSIVGLIYYLIPDSKAIILQLWNDDEVNDK